MTYIVSISKSGFLVFIPVFCGDFSMPRIGIGGPARSSSLSGLHSIWSSKYRKRVVYQTFWFCLFFNAFLFKISITINHHHKKLFKVRNEEFFLQPFFLPTWTAHMPDLADMLTIDLAVSTQWYKTKISTKKVVLIHYILKVFATTFTKFIQKSWKIPTFIIYWPALVVILIPLKHCSVLWQNDEVILL